MKEDLPTPDCSSPAPPESLLYFSHNEKRVFVTVERGCWASLSPMAESTHSALQGMPTPMKHMGGSLEHGGETTECRIREPVGEAENNRFLDRTGSFLFPPRSVHTTQENLHIQPHKNFSSLLNRDFFPTQAPKSGPHGSTLALLKGLGNQLYFLPQALLPRPWTNGSLVSCF